MLDPACHGKGGLAATHRAWLACMSMVAALAMPEARAATSVMIWPIDPVIEPGQSGVALWLENHDKRPAVLQIRVVGWRQEQGEDIYDDTQDRIAGSPPMAVVEPGQRQLIRLTRLAETPPGTEEAYRVLIDEVPEAVADSDEGARAASSRSGIAFRMHYSIPLFVYGRGLRAAKASKPDDDAVQPVLCWRIEGKDGHRTLVLKNKSPVHARITRLVFRSQDSAGDREENMLGYALPGTSMRWPLPDDVVPGFHRTLLATVNGRADVAIAADEADGGGR